MGFPRVEWRAGGVTRKARGASSWSAGGVQSPEWTTGRSARRRLRCSPGRSYATPVRVPSSPQVVLPNEWAKCSIQGMTTIERAATTARDGRTVAIENEIRLLRGISRFGWLRTRDAAVLVWRRWARTPATAPDLAPQQPNASALRMAQRTLRRLRKQHAVLRSRAPDGSWIYALAAEGVRRLQSRGINAISGKDLIRTFSSSHYRHRCIANEIAIRAIVQGYRVATEREIAQGLWLGGKDGVGGKVPDVLIQHDGAVWWVEVERSRKNAVEYARLLSWLGYVSIDKFNTPHSKLLGQNRHWERVIFVCTPAFQQRLVRDLIVAGWKSSQVAALLTFSTVLYKFQEIEFQR